MSTHELKNCVWSNFVMYFFLFYDLFYNPWLSYLLEWKESDQEKERTNKLIVKKFKKLVTFFGSIIICWYFNIKKIKPLYITIDYDLKSSLKWKKEKCTTIIWCLMGNIDHSLSWWSFQITFILFVLYYVYRNVHSWRRGKGGHLVYLFWWYAYHFYCSFFMANQRFVALITLKDYVVLGNWKSFD